MEIFQVIQTWPQAIVAIAVIVTGAWVAITLIKSI